MSYQTKIEMCVRVIGYSVALLFGFGLEEAVRRVEPTAARISLMIGCVCLGAVAIQKLMEYLRERAGV